MKHKKRNVTWVVLLILIIACNGRKEAHKGISEADSVFSIEDKGKYNLSDFFTDYSAVLLRGDLIRTIQRLIVCKSKMYFLASGQFYYYDSLTQTARLILGRGKGPDEMMSITAIKVFQDTLYAFDNIRRDMRRFHLDGTFIDKINPGDAYEYFEFIDENTLVGYKGLTYGQHGNEYKINIIKNYKEENKEVVNACFPLSQDLFERGIRSDNLYRNADNSISFTHPFTDTVYSISKAGGISAKYRFDFKDNGIPYKQYADPRMGLSEFSDYRIKENKIGFVIVRENSKFIFFTYMVGKKLHSCFINKSSGRVVSGSQFVDDIISKSVTHHFSSEFFPFYMDEKSLYIVAQPYYFMDELQMENLIKPTPLTELSIESNPVILKLNFK